LRFSRETSSNTGLVFQRPYRFIFGSMHVGYRVLAQAIVQKESPDQQVVMGMPVPLAIAEASGRVMDLAERRQQSVIIALIDPLVTL
jgi:hypothetical protein